MEKNGEMDISISALVTVTNGDGLLKNAYYVCFVTLRWHQLRISLLVFLANLLFGLTCVSLPSSVMHVRIETCLESIVDVLGTPARFTTMEITMPRAPPLSTMFPSFPSRPSFPSFPSFPSCVSSISFFPFMSFCSFICFLFFLLFFLIFPSFTSCLFLVQEERDKKTDTSHHNFITLHVANVTLGCVMPFGRTQICSWVKKVPAPVRTVNAFKIDTMFFAGLQQCCRWKAPLGEPKEPLQDPPAPAPCYIL